MILRNCPSEPVSSKPYQGVRVKDPVRELLRRKRGSHNATSVKTPPPTAVVIPNSISPSYTHVGPSGLLESCPGAINTISGSSSIGSSGPDTGAFYTGWLAQPGAPSFQPLSHWPSSDYFQTNITSSSSSSSTPTSSSTCPLVPGLSPEMYVQPVCPSYTVVAPSSLLTLTHAPLFTNIGAITPTPASLPSQVDFHAMSDSPLAYIPWPQPLATLPGAQPLATLPGPLMQYPPPCPITTTSPIAQLPPMPQVPPTSLVAHVPPMPAMSAEHAPVLLPEPVHPDSITAMPCSSTTMSSPMGLVPLEPEVPTVPTVPMEHIPVPLEEPDHQPLDLEEEEEPNPLEKLLEDGPRDQDPYVCSASVFAQGV
ncbi:POU domain class 2-associating factor 1 [Engraulis encrasicolus]|uniref:POU domain class 2-associating factor 1 n=1 Tax=Engraulis encrasicolus TaxID=184585 RepID=UPI002FD4543A